jgi:hypothetical protein
MQHDLVQPHLSVHEAMIIAADLKLGSELTKKQKLILVSLTVFLWCITGNLGVTLASLEYEVLTVDHVHLSLSSILL